MQFVGQSMGVVCANNSLVSDMRWLKALSLSATVSETSVQFFQHYDEKRQQAIILVIAES